MTFSVQALVLLLQIPDPHGPDLASTLRLLAWISILVAVIGLVLVEFVWRPKLGRTTYRWLLVFGLFVFPAFALLGTSGSMFEEMKTVESCNSCHVMEPFVDDMHDPGSATLAARHFATGAIPKQQCYACHTGYGIFGTAEAKRDGFRHWLLYVTRTWEEPITFKGSYPHQNCLDCHVASPDFRAVESHRALADELRADEMGCVTCHAMPHPPRPLRAPAAHGDAEGEALARAVHLSRSPR